MRIAVAVVLLFLVTGRVAAAGVTFDLATASVETYDFAEVTIHVTPPPGGNPFTDVTVRGSFGVAGDTVRTAVEGFCDSPDGSVFRIRFMPSRPGEYAYSVIFRHGSLEQSTTGVFRATEAHRRGPIRVDPAHPWHFIWEGTGGHYFFNGTTAFWIAGWRDERVIQASIDRLHRLEVNRIRALLAGAANIYWGEPVMTGENFTMMLRPWVAAAPDSFDHPGIDYSKFDVAYWQKWERMLRYARDRDVVVSAILDISTHSTQAAAGSDDEKRYVRYAVARLSAFSNLTWDLGDDLDTFRDEVWAHATGSAIEEWDPYHHLATSHPVHREHQDRASAWFGFTSIQDWSRRQHALMLEERHIQLKTGRIIPQTNEEYGYEDHYPRWAPQPPGDSADTLRRVAWDIAMAGAYGTAGETARRGTNIWPDTGGGWINGRSDDTTTMLNGYAHMVDFFTGFAWWTTDPHDELVTNGAYCLAKPGELYAIYLPDSRTTTLTLGAGTYRAQWFSAVSGEVVPIGEVQGPTWTTPEPPGSQDWAVLLTKDQ
jgi:Protein of unknown function (DUF4038)/Domain of unknown function (DUF5060)/Putative collagen-binding domain of a collagenase